eukprot:scaffold78124_cov48-Cyclotella_meneghiniana.AAC.1
MDDEATLPFSCFIIRYYAIALQTTAESSKGFMRSRPCDGKDRASTKLTKVRHPVTMPPVACPNERGCLPSSTWKLHSSNAMQFCPCTLNKVLFIPDGIEWLRLRVIGEGRNATQYLKHDW